MLHSHLSSLRFHTSIYGRLLAIHVRAQLQYRASFLFEIGATALTMFMYFGTIMLIFQRFDHLGGWTLGQVAFLWALVEIAFGLMDMIFSGFDPSSFGQHIRRGTFDQLLLRPVNITVQVLGMAFVLRRVGRIFQGVAVFVIALSLADISWSVDKLLFLPLVIVGLVGYFGGLFIIGSTITFWTIESIEAVNVLTYGGSEMMAYPMHIYPSWLRKTFTYVLPAIFLNYYPALYFLDKPDPFGLPVWAPFIAPIVGLGMLSVALAFWRVGIRHYRSTGT